MPLFDEPKAAPVKATQAENDAYWSGFAAGYHQHAGLEPRDERQAQYWRDGRRLGALFRPRARATR